MIRTFNTYQGIIDNVFYISPLHILPHATIPIQAKTKNIGAFVFQNRKALTNYLIPKLLQSRNEIHSEVAKIASAHVPVPLRSRIKKAM